MKYKYYYCEFIFEGETIRRNIRVEQNSRQLLGQKDKQIIEESVDEIITIFKKSTKFNFDNGQF